MIISTSILKSSMEKYQDAVNKERYMNTGRSMVAETIICLISLTLVVFELVMFFYAIKIAIECTHGGVERIIHLTLAIFFTLPYVLISVFFSDCAKNLIHGGSSKSSSANFRVYGMDDISAANSNYNMGGGSCGMSSSNYNMGGGGSCGMSNFNFY